MKRTKMLTAADSNTKAKVIIHLDSPRGGLTKWEQDALLHSIASGIMQTLANARYLHVSLSEVKVK